MSKLIVLLLASVWMLGCQNKKTEIAWQQSIARIGSQSSPRATDLNGDGVDDLVMGAGENEYQTSEYGVLAFDGKSGALLWKHPCIDQVYTSATFLDITKDGISDIFIGGRSNQFFTIDGKNGQSLWKWEYTFENHSILKYSKFNFQNAVLLPDQNGDGMQDLLVQCGGNPKAAPGTMVDRYPGVLMILDSKTGAVIAADTMPDGKESYMPPIYFKNKNGSEKIVFGSGGETLDGHLYISDLAKLKAGKLSEATILASEKGHGFIAPTVAADINEDGFYDLVAISHGSNIYAFDGQTNTILWRKNLPATESSNGFAVGQFTGDKTPDFFTFVSKGVWPESKGSVEIMIDGKTGEIAYQANLGCTGFSSPAIYDLNDDGIDEAVISINEYDCEAGFVSEDKLDISNKLIAIDFKNNQIQTIDEQKKFKNIFSTPFIGDLDHDGYIDIVYNQYFSPNSILMAFMGLKINRISTGMKVRKPVLWGSYMGTHGNGVFK